MLKISNIKLPLSVFSKDREIPEERILTRYLSKELREREEEIRKLSIQKKSIDARKKPDIFILYSVTARFSNEDVLLKKYKGRLSIERYSEKKYEVTPLLKKAGQKRPLIVGDGPAGLFAAYILALSGLDPIVFERGAAAEEREAIVKDFFSGKELSKNTNVCFGEGGAGTFSDGKLNTLTKDRDGRQVFVLETFQRFGADKNILYDAKPHIGTDRLLLILPAMRKAIEALGYHNFCSIFFIFRQRNNTLPDKPFSPVLLNIYLYSVSTAFPSSVYGIPNARYTTAYRSF